MPTFLVSKLVKNHCTVALGGDGGDELFGGYSKYLDLIKYKEMFDFIPWRLRKTFSDSAISKMPIGMKGRNWLQYFSFDYLTNNLILQNHFDGFSQKKLFKKGFSCAFAFDSIYNQMSSKNNDLIRNATELDFRTYLTEDILVKLDRSSMMNSLEVRAPFLDFEIIEFAFKSVPSELKVGNGDKKILLKSLCKLKLPEQFDFNRKQGFSMPLYDLLKDKKWQRFIADTLSDISLDFFDKKYISQLINSINSGRMNSERIFGILFLCIWVNKHKLTL
jgi:asparagine synthase (glutamine-hydrolysing)